MDKREPSEKREMHIDTSSRLYENKDTGIAYKIIQSNGHKGLVLSKNLKKELEKNLRINKDYARVYAICIYYLIKEDLDKFDILVVCSDEKYYHVKRYLDLLFEGSGEYSKKYIMSINKLREIMENVGLESYAHKISNSYRKRGLKSIVRKQKGIFLNVVEINYNKIKDKWFEIEEKLNISRAATDPNHLHAKRWIPYIHKDFTGSRPLPIQYISIWSFYKFWFCYFLGYKLF